MALLNDERYAGNEGRVPRSPLPTHAWADRLLVLSILAFSACGNVIVDRASGVASGAGAGTAMGTGAEIGTGPGPGAGAGTGLGGGNGVGAGASSTTVSGTTASGTTVS